MKANPKFGAPMGMITKNPSHLRLIFEMYLDVSKPIKTEIHSGKFWRIMASGTGLDGEPQILSIDSSCGFKRLTNDPYDGASWSRKKLPVLTGKIYHILQNLGYDVGINGREQAARYEKSAINGISNLGTNDHRDALIEKQERQLERRKAAAEALESSHSNYSI